MTAVAIIPARGGSKRIPRKNIKLFFGKPIIGWSIEAAIKSNCFDRIIVSTDDKEIADIALKFGAEVPFTRPQDLSNDYAGTIPVIRHAIEWLEGEGQVPDFVCCLYAAAPFVQPEDLNLSFQQISADKDLEYVFTATTYPFPIQRAIKQTPGNGVAMFQPEHANTRSQDLVEAFHDAGQFYWGRKQSWLQEHPIYSSKSSMYLLPASRVQDIDTIDDWSRAEWLFQAMESLESMDSK